ncbi:MAG TPA: C25 family cysteine peptidase [Bacteroidales bacterium]|nr:C25 family cysteine peptidase [Bacteroidales bacterium]
MKKFTFLLVFSFAFMGARSQTFSYTDNWGKAGYNILEATPSHVQLVYSMPVFSLEDISINGEAMKDISLPGNLLFNDAGAPNLPSKGRYLAIPTGSVPRVTIVARRTEVLHNVNIAPAPKIPLGDDDTPLHYAKNQAIYSQNANYPASPVQISQVMHIRGVDAIIIGTTPFQYNPVTRDLTIYKDLRIEVSFDRGNGQFGNTLYRNKWWDPILSDMMLNYSSLPVIDYDQRFQTYSPSSKDVECEYIIICPTGPAFQAWADTIRRFRNQQGILTHVYTLDDVGGNTTTAIENFIDNAYNNWTIKPVACLLLGDYGTDGTKNIISPLLHHDAGYPDFAADNKYADVDGDVLPDVVFSRITANDSSQLRVMVTKFLTNERTPVTDPVYYSKPITSIGWETDRWFQLCGEIVGGYFRNVQGKTPRRINAVYQGNPGSTWSTAANTSQITSYFGPAGLGYIPATPAELGGWSGGNAAKINAAIDSGAFMMLHRDHGEYIGWGEPSYHSSDVVNLTNNALIFVFSINCQTGAYHRSTECFGETFHRHTYNGYNSGALGVVCPTEVSYSFVNDTFVWGMFDNMWDDFMPSENPNPPSRGALPAFGHAAGKYFLKQSSWPSDPQEKNITFNLFHMHGDAFTMLYYEVPQPLTVTHDNTILEGSTTFNISANEGASIGLTVNDAIIATGTGQGATPVAITIPPQTAGTMVRVTVTKQNYFRYTALVPVVSDALVADFTATATQICPGSSVDFTDISSGIPTGWSWTFTGGTPPTSNVQNPQGIVFSNPGDFAVSLTVTRDTLSSTTDLDPYIQVHPFPAAAFQYIPACFGQPTDFTDQTNGNGGTVNMWRWNFGDPSSGTYNTSTLQNPSHTFLSAGYYHVTLVALNNSTCADTITQDVLVLDLPGIAAVPSGPAEICQGSTGNLYTTAGTLYATSYGWEVTPTEAGTFTGDSATVSFNASATFTGAATVFVKGVNDCGEGSLSAGFPVTVNPLPSPAARPSGPDSVNLNKVSHTDFTADPVQDADSYTWQIDPVDAGTISGTGLTGSVDWDHTYRGDAHITVLGVNNCGTGNVSADKKVTVYAPVGIEELNPSGFLVYPNPSSGKLNITLRSGIPVTLDVKIFNPVGTVVYTENSIRLESRSNRTLDLTNLSAGVYFLKIESANGSFVKKIVIEK